MEKGKQQSKQKPRKGSDGLDRKTGAGGKKQEQPEPNVQKETSPREKCSLREMIFPKSRKAGKKRDSTTTTSNENETQQNLPPELPPKTYKYYLNTALNEIQVHKISEKIYTSGKREPDQELMKPQKEERHEEVEEEVSAGCNEVDGLSETMAHNKTQKTHTRNISAWSIGSFHIDNSVQLTEELFSGEEWAPFLENHKTLSPDRPMPTTEDPDQPVTNTYYMEPIPFDEDYAIHSVTEHTPVLEDHYLKFIVNEPKEVVQPAPSPVQDELPESEAEPVVSDIEDILKSVTIIESKPKVVGPKPEEDEPLHPLPPKLATSTATATHHRVFRSSVFYRVPPPGQETQLDSAKGGAKTMGKEKAMAKNQSAEETVNIGSSHADTPVQLVEEPYSDEERGLFFENQKTLPLDRPVPTLEV